jgi:hypothetical protein
VSITKTNCLGKKNRCYLRELHLTWLCGQGVDFLNFKASGAYRNYLVYVFKTVPWSADYPACTEVFVWVAACVGPTSIRSRNLDTAVHS